MKYLNEMQGNEALAVILSTKTLSEKLSKRIYESEIEFYLGDKLRCFRDGCAEYSIGVYNTNYFCVSENSQHGFLDGVEESIRCFDSSERVKAKAKKCRKLEGSNLFKHEVDELCRLYYEDELAPIVKFVEDCSYDIYSKDADSKNLLDYVDLFIEDYGDKYYVEDGQVYQVATIVK